MTELRSGEAGTKAKLHLSPESLLLTINQEALECSMLNATSSLEDTLSSSINLFKVLIN